MINKNVLDSFLEAKKCPMCKYEIEGMLREDDEINPIFLVHYYHTHGVPPIFMVDKIAEVLFTEQEERNNFINKHKHYEEKPRNDKAHGRNLGKKK